MPICYILVFNFVKISLSKDLINPVNSIISAVYLGTPPLIFNPKYFPLELLLALEKSLNVSNVLFWQIACHGTIVIFLFLVHYFLF